jgi:LysR family transcriptional regulator, glycine cleavage system transcriptional activator
MADRLPPMQALRAFDAAARTGSLTRAAEGLHLTHGAISHQIKALEEELGVKLVERSGRGIRLTDEGERFASRVRAALTELADAVREITDRRNPRQLRLTTMPSFAARWLLPRTARFLKAHPDIDLEIRSSNALVDFRREDIDIAIRYYPRGDWPGLVAEPLMDDFYFPVCSPKLPRLPKRPADLAKHTLLRAEGEEWTPWFKAAGLDWPEPARGPLFTDSAHMMQAAVERQGIAIGRSSLMGDDLRNRVLVKLFDVVVPSTRKYWLVYPQRLAGAPKLEAFKAWLQQELKRRK